MIQRGMKKQSRHACVIPAHVTAVGHEWIRKPNRDIKSHLTKTTHSAINRQLFNTTTASDHLTTPATHPQHTASSCPTPCNRIGNDFGPRLHERALALRNYLFHGPTRQNNWRSLFKHSNLMLFVEKTSKTVTMTLHTLVLTSHEQTTTA
eukprot:scpid99420/ scgid25376/ 